MCVQGYRKKPLPHNSATRLSFALLSHIYDDRLYYDIYIETIIDIAETKINLALMWQLNKECQLYCEMNYF